MLNSQQNPSTGELHFQLSGFFTQLMLQCVLEFLTEFVLRFYSKILDKFRFPVCRQSGDLRGVCGNNSYETLSHLKMKFCFFPGILWRSEYTFIPRTIQHYCPHPFARTSCKLNPQQAHRSHSNTENGIKTVAHFKHIMEIPLSLPKNPLHSHGHS